MVEAVGSQFRHATVLLLLFECAAVSHYLIDGNGVAQEKPDLYVQCIHVVIHFIVIPDELDNLLTHFFQGYNGWEDGYICVIKDLEIVSHFSYQAPCRNRDHCHPKDG